MENFFLWEGRDEVEELEPVEELIAVDEDELRPGPSESPLLDTTELKTVIRSYERIPEPMAVVDGSMGFIFRNSSFRDLMKAFSYPETPTLLDSFSRSIGPSKSKDILAAIAQQNTGYAWKGTIAHKVKNAAAIITKVHIFPFYARETDGPGEKPQSFSVYLDDVTAENRKFLHDMFSSLLEASKLKDNDTGKHIERVNLYASALAKELYNDARWPEVDKDFIEDIGFLAAMHDVGKIGTPDDILNKEGPLNEFEWGIMKEHTKNGAFILSSYPNPMAKEIALSHHEWWNGSGYPYNMEGKMIPLAARIVTLADVYDALRMKRSYKPAYSHEVAMQKIRQERDVHFDPELVDMVLRIQGNFAEIYAQNAD
jgi:Response regulator containing a CheY-like receiver domain and an HD-GYP domain